MDTADRTARNELFQELKPYCIELSQIALRNGQNLEGIEGMRNATSRLLQVLERNCCREDGAFDDKLADYIFFPLSHVFKSCQKTPGRLAELAVQCLVILLRYGWRWRIPLDLAMQLLVLLTFFAGGGGSPEELRTGAYVSISCLFDDIRVTAKGSSTLTETINIPALSHCLTTILEGITHGPTPQCQEEALIALQSLWLCIKDPGALSNFLPGTVSSLTKSLTPSIKAPRSRKVLVAALTALQNVLVTCLGDVRTRNLLDSDPDTENNKSLVLTKAWLTATASQVKLALANIVKLRKHQHEDVRVSLSGVCLVLLDECHASLIEAAPLLVETVMMISSKEVAFTRPQTSLKDLALIHESVAELVKVTSYDWVTQFPRIMQSSDESVRRDAMGQLSGACSLMSDLALDSGVLQDAIADSLRNGVTSMIGTWASKIVIEETVPYKFDGALFLARYDVSTVAFNPVLMPQESLTQTRVQLDKVLQSLGSSQTKIRLASSMILQLGNQMESNFLSSLWLSFQLLKASITESKRFEDFLTPLGTSSVDQEQVLQQLYEISLEILSEDDDIDWRIQAVALEIVAYQALSLADDFRPDLLDSLYPIIQLLGSSHPQLRDHAITSLNSISSACNYSSTSSMIVQNADYLVNAVSLKLNTLNVSSRTPQVLIMMIKLSGPSLLPHLDDVVSSVFATLDNFHGYPRLVEALFSVLAEIVDEGRKSGQLRLTAGEALHHRKQPNPPSTIEDIAKALAASKSRSDARQAEQHVGFPREPWKSAKQLLDKEDPAKQTNGDEEPEGLNGQPQEIVKQPLTKVYTMVQNITRLGQHFLTNASPLLRRRLLDLISISSKSLHGNEEHFLPLVNDVWPVIIQRLYDDETFIVIAASSCIAELCRCAGDFMATRIEAEWPDLTKLIRKWKAKALLEKKGKHARGIYAQSSQVWEGLVELSVVVVQYVRIREEMFDEALALLGDELMTREDVYEAFSVVNADAVWLEKLKKGLQPGPTPIIEGHTFASVNLEAYSKK